MTYRETHPCPVDGHPCTTSECQSGTKCNVMAAIEEYDPLNEQPDADEMNQIFSAMNSLEVVNGS